jgi:serpin B
MIRSRSTHWVILCCVAVVALPMAAGSLLGLLIVNQFRPVADRSVSALSETYNVSGQDLFAQVARAGGGRPQLASELPPGDGNIVFSPYSIGTVMALAMSGARGETEAEMARALRRQLPRAEHDSANGKTLAILQRYDRKAGPARLATANAVMLTKHGHLISNDYLASAKAHYAAEIFRDADLATVNNWVSQKTEGKIERIIDRLDPKTVTVLLNAVYFKARWREQFDSKLTQPAPFAISSSQSVEVPMMQRDGFYPLVAEPGFLAIRIPYAAPQLSMVIVLPDKIDGLGGVSSRLEGGALAGLFARLRGTERHVDLRLPRFKAKSEVKLKDHFHALGMIQAFDEARADFSGMTGGSRGIHIEDVIHQAVIEVAEEGTEAAAATAVPMIASAPPTFHVNRPFLFYVVEATTNTILFQGRIADPR